MRKSFYQMLQLIEGNITNQHNINQYDNYANDNYIEQVLFSIKDEDQRKIIAVKLALYYAKDCFRLIPEGHVLKILAENCINAIESWLIDPNSVTEERLRRLARVNVNFGDDQDFIISAIRSAQQASSTTAYVINYNENLIPYNSAYAVYDAYYSYETFYEANNQNAEMLQQKLQEYKSYLTNLIHNYHANITFDNDTDYQSLQQELPNRNNPNTWNSNQWFYYLLKLKDQNNIPIIVQHNDSWIINPNLGNYNAQTDTQEELISMIAEIPQFKELRLKLANI